jgi:acetyltransferase-like isoleucine patch superfamily enzyme
VWKDTLDKRVNCEIGEHCVIDASAVVGHLPGRKIAIEPAIIGDHAHIRSSTAIYTNTRIGTHLETGHGAVIREENAIGDHFSIWNNSTIDYGCSIGNRVRIHCNVYICQFTTIEDDVFLGPGVITANDPCPVCTKCMKGPTIKRGAKIGAQVTILPAVTIGEDALIGAGSVVTKDIPSGALAYGNPAKVVGSVYDMQCKKGVKERPYKRTL